MKHLFTVFCSLTISFTAFADAATNPCVKAYDQIKRTNIAALKTVEDACNAQVQPTCEAITDKLELGASDAALVLMVCALTSAYSSNIKAGNGDATKGCENAIIYIYSPNTLTVARSASTCLIETQSVCNGQATELTQAICRAESAYAAFTGTDYESFKLSPELEKAAEDTAQAEQDEFLRQLGITK